MRPTGIVARAADGTLYWTCLSAGVIQQFSNGVRTTLIRQLSSPSVRETRMGHRFVAAGNHAPVRMFSTVRCVL